MGERQQALRQWAAEQLGENDLVLEPASSDASFRRYFRVVSGEQSHILMDAPPPQEDVRPFVRIAEALHQVGVNVPEIRARDLERGFLLLGDLGNRVYLDELSPDTVDRLYGDALGALLTIQACGPGKAELPPYDRTLLMNEMGLFRDWLLGRHLGIELEPDQLNSLETTFARLAELALSQPRVCVHRDFHSRNLMLTTQHNPGVLDFQDAVFGPVTYDLVSLLRDCYIAWPREQVEDWALGYRELAMQSGVIREDAASEATFLHWFDWMGVQRHLKAAGIFARLNERDNKPGYLADIPRTLGYILEVAPAYPELAELAGLIERRVLPALKERAA